MTKLKPVVSMAKYDKAYLSSGSSLLVMEGMLVQFIGLLLLIDLIEAVHLEELEVLQLRHLGQPRPTWPAHQSIALSAYDLILH